MITPFLMKSDRIERAIDKAECLISK